MYKNIVKLTLFMAISLPLQNVLAAGDSRPSIENDSFRLRLSPRTPSQIAAFYEARGFPEFAINELKQTCFIGIGLRNKSRDIVWFDLSNWRITTPDGTLQRYLRSHWKKRWQELGLEKRFQSTFRWTLLPEQLDFRAFETEGGNITLPRTSKPMTITGQIMLGKNRSKLVNVRFEGVRCANDPQ